MYIITTFPLRFFLSLSLWMLLLPGLVADEVVERVVVSPDGKSFVLKESGTPFVVWGVNYDRDEGGRLIEDYWDTEWQTVVDDFAEIKALGANVVRVHLQLGRFMETATQPRAVALARLAALVIMAEKTGLYLDITGLGCYHKTDIPPWYDALPEAERWAVQARFWLAVAEVGAASPAVFCYNLMNEPIIGGKADDGWLGGALENKYYVQRIAIDLAGRDKKDVARSWIDTLVTAIRKHDHQALVTVGVIPWILVFGEKAKPLFYDPVVSERLDFASVHFYPKSGEIDKALTALARYDIGKPLVIEEIFPMHCSADELADFIKRSRSFTDGWISFYWGTTIEELEAQPTSITNSLKIT